MNKNDLMKKYHNKHIQLSKNVISDIIDDIQRIKGKVLVFGLGHDSELWFNANDKKNIWFIEENKAYIDMNKNIPKEYVIYHKYENLFLMKNYSLSDKDLSNYPWPQGIDKILDKGFDLILIDGPTGWLPHSPGRLLATYWAVKKWSHKNTIFYLDDTNRRLETLCIYKFMSNMAIKKYDNPSSTIRTINK